MLFFSHGQQPEMKGSVLKRELNDNVCITRCFCSSKDCLMEFFYFTMKQERNLQVPSFPKWKGLYLAMLLEYAATELHGELLNQLWRV